MAFCAWSIVMIDREMPFEELHVSVCPSVVTHQTIAPLFQSSAPRLMTTAGKTALLLTEDA